MEKACTCNRSDDSKLLAICKSRAFSWTIECWGIIYKSFPRSPSHLTLQAVHGTDRTYSMTLCSKMMKHHWFTGATIYHICMLPNPSLYFQIYKCIVLQVRLGSCIKPVTVHSWISIPIDWSKRTEFTSPPKPGSAGKEMLVIIYVEKTCLKNQAGLSLERNQC